MTNENRIEESQTMTTKHTPGPWVVNHCTRRNPYGTYRFEISDDEGKDVPAIAFVETSSTIPPEPGCENEANANLIAAAPDLLAALRKAVSWDKNRPAVARGSLHEAFYMEVPEWVYEARAALAKAEGK